MILQRMPNQPALPSKNTSSSNHSCNLFSHCFVLSENCAREAGSLGASGHVNNNLSYRSSRFFNAKWSHKGLQKYVTILQRKQTWNQVHKTYRRNLKTDALNPSKNEFLHMMVARNHYNWRCGQCKPDAKTGVQMLCKSVEIWPKS